MRAYLIRRVLLLIPTFLLLSILVFLSVRFIPGDAVDALAGQQQYMGTDINREALKRMLGLDQPVHVQYGRWLGGIFLHGTLGPPTTSGGRWPSSAWRPPTSGWQC